VETRVTRLEMRVRPETQLGPPPRPGVMIVEARRITASFYRYLYDTVGELWCWTGRRLIDDAELLRRVRAAGVAIHVLWVEGVPAGYVEIERDAAAGEAFIAYFGLMPDFIGAGLGRWFLDWAVCHAWEARARRLVVQTCDLDHPAALPNYQRAGFVPCGEFVETVSLIAGMEPRRTRPFRRPLAPAR
jgi:GNAT superfamily N-acetyltransferase